ncbi:putative serine/threonine-protein kinase PIX13 [Vitis vinifera]|uniref:non-specific serine/threonine protein kinase n=1 Tax=Vitis vinifera TaxID=29760 RepID=A0A438K4E2_VITVI|nr:putative serine/threonine-protein kinase PIX13 [Vitis vinifera]
MGNCCGAQANVNPASRKPPSPAELSKNNIKQDKSIKERSGSGSGNGSSNGGEKTEIAETGTIITPNLKMFTFAELKSATRNFRPHTMLGEGGFGRVFKGWVDEKTYAPTKVSVGIPVAVKKSNPESEQGLKEWQSEVKFLGKFTHPNLVKLLGYCCEDQQFLLVYEYMHKGSLENHLFKLGAESLTWEIRLKIAIGAARGLAFLHTSEKTVIYRDFKGFFNYFFFIGLQCQLSDFGLAKLGPSDGDSHVTTQIVGTYGYAAPEYIATGHLYVKSDVYGFGVVLLEMLTGKQTLDRNRPPGQLNLVEWTKPLLPNKRKLKKIMDPRLRDQYPLKAATQVAELILKCLESDPKNRPSMEEVLETLKRINEIKEKPNSKEAKAATTQPQPHHHRSPHRPKHGGTGAGIGARTPPHGRTGRRG